MYNLLVIHHISWIILGVYEKNKSEKGLAAFNDGDNSLVLIFRSLNVPMEISIGDLASYNKPGLAVVGRFALQTKPVHCVIAAN